MNTVFFVDPLETFNLKKDTSYILILEAYKRYKKVYVVYEHNFIYTHKSLYLDALEIIPPETIDESFKILTKKRMLLNEVDIFFIRKDPPFNISYLIHMWMLSNPSKKPFFINSPEGILKNNEKLAILNFPSLIPDTLITRNLVEYKKFLKKYKKIIIKPMNGFGGSGIFYVHEEDPNIHVIFETLLEKYNNEYLIVQEYLSLSQQGDKRILLLNGEVLGSVLRVHSKEDHRNNFAAGGIPKKTRITSQEYKIIDNIKNFLIQNHLIFVGIDLIQEKLIEINVTSPTCLQEINTLESCKLQENIFQFIENSV